MHTIIEYSDAIHRRQVIALWETVFGYEDSHNKPGLAIDKKLAAPDGLFFVAVEDDTVIGTVLAGYDGHRGWLYAVAVHPAHRQQGLGKALVRFAEQALTARGCLKINLQIIAGNDSAAGFYESLGYAVEPRVSMGKKLDQNLPPI
jgi:ribosomal protein S18 acetylase RimI-like enzyme